MTLTLQRTADVSLGDTGNVFSFLPRPLCPPALGVIGVIGLAFVAVFLLLPPTTTTTWVLKVLLSWGGIR